MKLNIYCMILGFMFFTFACEGPPGPQGPEGPAGEDGLDGLIGYTFDFEGIDFTATNSYEAFLSFGDFEVFDSDVVVVYLLWEIDSETDNPIWRPLPQTVFTEWGLLQYNYDFTINDVKVFLNGDFELGQLGAGDTDNQYFRVVVIPADFVDNGRVGLDVSDYYALAEQYGLKTGPVDEKYKELLKHRE